LNASKNSGDRERSVPERRRLRVRAAVRCALTHALIRWSFNPFQTALTDTAMPQRHPLKPARRLLIAAALGCALPAAASADANFPERSIRIVVPYSPGGSADQSARFLADRLGQRLGQSVVVDNRPGASGNIGTVEVMNAKPDGYTLLLGFDGTLVVQPSVTKVPFDSIKSFQPVILIDFATLALGAHPSVPANTIGELIEYSKKNPQKLTFGTTGTGSTPHLAGELLRIQHGLQWLHVPYKGGAQALNDTLGGSTPLVMTAVATLQAHAKAGRVKIIGVGTPQRSQAAPEVPTFSESGAPGFSVASWFGLLAPAGTPRPVVDKLNREVAAVLAEPAIRDRYLGAGLELAPGTPEQFGDLIRTDLERWKRVATQANIKID
jgi:tripartite-type tricarboxylate transporter receptor subunit TctC